MTYTYDLTLGLPHTNYRGLSEPLLLMHAGHFQWASIAAATGGPLSRLRTASGGEVYAAFYYIEEKIPPTAPLEAFGLDDVVRFRILLRSFKNVVVEGSVVFDRPDRFELPGGAVQPSIRFGNIFITPVGGNSMLRVAPPVNADFSGIAPLPNDENPYHLTRAAAETGSLGLLDPGWTPIEAPFEHLYAIDVDRDTNGAELVYFANYVSYMETAERLALANLPDHLLDRVALAHRSLRRRRIAYYGNVDVSDTIRVRVTVLSKGAAPGTLAFRYAIEREEDGRTICLSEALKALPPA
jgi:probable biosynthetic protein (TIGR04098 family)